MHLAFSSAGTDGAPADEITNVLWCDRIEIFGTRPETTADDVEQQLPSRAKPLVDIKRVVEVRIVDQTLPADGGTWLFKVDAHDDL